MPDDGSATSSVAPPWVAQVLDFWFRELGEETWWTASSDLDLSGPRPLLAGIVVLDQFSRNMFRGTSRMFAADPIALRLAEQAIALRLDAAMTPAERHFVYLPFEHSEDREHQALAVRLIEPLGDETWTRFARAHQLVIERFGRFPHRNAILGRTSSPDELQFLKEPMEPF